jgi:hypothetical protein
MNSQMPRKRGREPEALSDSIDVREPKRLDDEETDQFLDLTVEDKEEEEYTPNEQLVRGVMGSLEEEIAATCFTSYLPSNSGDNATTSDICRDHEGKTLDSDAGVDLSYLLNVSEDELDIPPSPAPNMKGEVCLSRNETTASLSENPDLKSLAENCHFEDDFENYQHLIALYEDPWNVSQLQDYMNKDFICPGMLFDDDFLEA